MDLLRQLNDFCDATTSGRRIAGELQIAAVRRFQSDLQRSRNADCPFYFDERKAEICIRFIGLLTHSTGDFDRKPFVLEPWQKFIVANLFGWINRATGKRRIRKAHIEIARKNGKTALAAAIALLLLFFDGEGRPEVYSVATERNQSKLCWEEACRFAAKNAWLAERSRVVESRYTMHGPDSGVFTALGADGGGTDGKNPSGCVFDEIHEFKTKKSLKLWSKMRTGSGMRKQPLFVTITTAGDKLSELWKSERKYAAAVAKGEHVDDSLFSFICCLDDEDDIFDESNWPKANPGLYSIKDPTEMRDWATAARVNPTVEHDLKRYHCNLLVEPVAKAISAASWASGAKPLPDLSGRICFGGIDIGTRDDLAAFWLTFPPENKRTGIFYTLGWAFCPADGERDLTKDDWPKWIENGSLIVTPGKETSFDAIIEQVTFAKAKYKLKAVALDPNNATQLGQDIEKLSIEVVGHGQRAQHYNEPLRSLKSAVNEGRVIHGDDPLMNWCIGNMVAKIAAGLMRPAKESSAEKIDPAVAFLMSYSIATLGTGSSKQTDGEARVRYA